MKIWKEPANSLLQSLAEGSMAVLDQLYDTHRNEFLRWAGQRFPEKNRDDLIDAWHDTMIMFYEQVRDKKVTHLTCDLKTFLFIIGLRRLLKMYKKSEKIDLVEEFDADMEIDHHIHISQQEEEVLDQKQRVIKAAVSELPEKSRQILNLRFMEGKSIPEIMKEMDYASENAVSVTLSRGLKKLKELLLNEYHLSLLRKLRIDFH